MAAPPVPTIADDPLPAAASDAASTATPINTLLMKLLPPTLLVAARRRRAAALDSTHRVLRANPPKLAAIHTGSAPSAMRTPRRSRSRWVGMRGPGGAPGPLVWFS